MVTVAGALDYETASSHTITVLATSSDGSTNTTGDYTINLVNVNDNGVSALSDSNTSANTVAENASIDTAVGITALAVDPDAGTSIAYSLTNNAGGKFAINGA